MNARLGLAAILAGGLLAISHAQVRLTCTTASGQVISGSHTFTVRAQSESLVTSVEFYVNGSLRTTDDSTPYEMSIDTLQENDGDLTVRADAYTEKGEKGSLTIKVKVDNGLGKGLEFHLDKGKDALANSRWDEAIYEGRVALKIKEDSIPAKIILSRANYGKGVNDLAQKYLEDVLAADPKNPDALNLLAGIQIDRAFLVTADASSTQAETITQIGASLKRAAEARAAYLNAQVDALPPATGSFSEERCRTMAAASRYSMIIQELQAKAQVDPKDNQVQNWTIYALLRAGRLKEAALLSGRLERMGAPDDYGWMLIALVKDRLGDDTGSRKAEEQALLSEANPLAVRTAQAYLALRRRQSKSFSAIAQELSRLDDAGTIPPTYLSTLHLMAGQYQECVDSIKKALLAEPGNYAAYVERANQIVLYTLNNPTMADDAKKSQRSLARGFYEAALGARPESPEALTGLGLLAGIEDRLEDAIRYLEASAKAAPDYSPASYGLSNAYSLVRAGLTLKIANETDRERKAALTKELSQWEGKGKAALDVAEKVDSGNLQGRTVPTWLQAWNYYYVRGRALLIPAP